MLELKSGRKKTTLEKGDLVIIGIYNQRRGQNGKTVKTTHRFWVERKGKVLKHNPKDTDAFMHELFNGVQFLPHIVRKVRAFKKLLSAFSAVQFEGRPFKDALISKDRKWGYEIPFEVVSL